MKTRIIISIFLFIILACGITGFFLSKYQRENSAQQCTIPRNPYQVGTREYAGFEWAENEFPKDCSVGTDSLSQEITTGCNEYYSELKTFGNCIDEIR
jgi:hypothetical protein